MRQPSGSAAPIATPRTLNRTRDEWLLPLLEDLIQPLQLAELRRLTSGSVWEAAVARGWCTDDTILAAVASRFRLRIANVGQVSGAALHTVTESLARRYHVLPLAISDVSVDIATCNPHDLDCERTLAFVLGRSVRYLLASPSQIATKLDELYRPEQVIEKILDDGFAGASDIEALGDAREELEFTVGKPTDRPIVRLVDRIVAKAIQLRSSDIHLEPEEQGVMVRYRIDGVLKDDTLVPRAFGLPLVARVKIMAQLDIADRLRPQDGRARIGIAGARIDLRISTLPAALGEKVVIRILDTRQTVLSLDGLGLNDDEAERIRLLLSAREGMIIVTGPTGSGKTTLLYSLVREIQKKKVNIVTVEDPVEYRLPGIVQVQVNEKTGLTFPSALRSILRQDPDVILVGEIRDRETAQVAVQASLTGHLVLTTLHTIDAVSSVTRLGDIGVEGYKLAAALKGIIAQRLLRRRCVSCGGVGCAECSSTGYRGRLPIVQVLVTNDDLERRISAGEPVDRIQAAARAAGMKSLWESAEAHVRRGTTTDAELRRVLEAPDALGPPSVRGGHRPGAPVPPYASGDARRFMVFEGGAFDLLEDYQVETAPDARLVVIIERDETTRAAAREHLERAGHPVREAQNGTEAISVIDRDPPHAIVIGLPCSGMQVLISYLRGRAWTRIPTVIVVAPDLSEATELAALEAGASDVLAKPLRGRVLVRRLQNLLRS